jgi:uncharacterized protein (TIGR03790 family)
MTRAFWSVAAVLLAVWRVSPAGVGDTVVVVYNNNLPESRKVAEHYAQRRNVPASHLFGVDVNGSSEVMSRSDFRERLQLPVLNWLIAQKLFTPNPRPLPEKPDPQYRFITEATIRYMVLCYGVPLKVARDSSLKDDAAEGMPEALQGRNEAAVDAEMALLP